MKLSSLQLEAFLNVVQKDGFSNAAKHLHLTQSALSQRVALLEEALGTKLLVRNRHQISLTETGQNLLRFCLTSLHLETEFLKKIGSPLNLASDKLSGTVRIASFSSHGRSILLPRLGAFFREHPEVRFEYQTRELDELPYLLRSGKADMVFSTVHPDKRDLEAVKVYTEQNILVTSSRYTPPKDLFIDHDSNDSTTERFWRIQSKPKAAYERIYFDEIYAIMDAAAEGLGQAVVPEHLLKSAKGLKPVPGLKPLAFPVYLIRPRQTVYSRLQKAIFEALSKP